MKPKRKPITNHYNPNTVFDWIVEFMSDSKGVPPTIREIMNGYGMTSTSVVHYTLARIERLGLIRLDRNGQARRFTVVGAQWIPPANRPEVTK